MTHDAPLALIASEGGTRFQTIDVARFGARAASDTIFGVVHPGVAHLVDNAAAQHVRDNRLVNAVTLIVEEVEPPLDDRIATEVTSFLVSGEVATAVRGALEPVRHWCYRLMDHVMASRSVPCELRIVHKRTAGRAPWAQSTSTGLPRCDVVLPHHGSESHLRLSLDSLLRQTQPIDILIAIDQLQVGQGFLADIADRERVHAFQLSPCPVGPYVARHALSMRSSADTIAFQDSDDLSLPHRIATLSAAARQSGAGIVGSHEVQVHQTDRKVYAVRYPLDVNASLRRSGANHQLLFPTALIARQVIERIDGFSTFRAFSLDVAFWLSASLTTRIINVDDFLYIRRRHPASLTMRPDIGTTSAVRRAIVARRRTDYSAIVDGRLRLEDSSLAVRHRTGPVAFTNIKTGEVTTVGFGASAPTVAGAP